MSAKVIAELGCNHGGDLRLAKRMMRQAQDCGADFAKFQKRTPSLMPRERYDAPYDNPHSFGKTYGLHREALEFSPKQHEELWNYGRQIGIPYLTSVWDIQAFDDIRHIPVDFLKIPSAVNEDWELLEHVARHWKRPVHISSGMTEDPKTLYLQWAELFGRERLTLYACTSTYPAPMHEVKLGDLARIQEAGCEAGFSGHHNGIALDVAAAVLGARYIERHFTLDRTSKGTDHAASLEPEGLRKLCRDLAAVEAAMGLREGMLPGERAIAEKLKIRKETQTWPKSRCAPAEAAGSPT